jgi:acetate kinase
MVKIQKKNLDVKKARASISRSSVSQSIVFNVGSSSIKYCLFSGTHLVLSQQIERITSATRKKVFLHIVSHIDSLGFKPDFVAHRIVHGGPHFSAPTLLTPSVINKLRKISFLAPLHDIPELEVVSYCSAHFGVKQYAVFDTAFHRTIPLHTQMYAIPKKYYGNGIQKYGFHGISHEFVNSGFTGRVITCHLGGGASICAIRDGVSVQTSMGFTPLDGLMMGTRCGTIGVGVVPFLVSHMGLSMKEVEHMLNSESGLLGIGGSSDVRDLLELSLKKTTAGSYAALALDMYVQRIIETIGSYIAVLGGVDTLVFTAGTGERSAIIRKRICDSFEYVGLKLDISANKKAVGVRLQISATDSKVGVYVVPTHEELAIVQKVLNMV